MKKSTPVIWITWDEAHKDTLGIYGAGTHETPAVDSLARCSIATGLMPHNTRSMSNHNGCALRNDLDHVFHLMHGRQYRTAVFGKCHFVPVPYGVTSWTRTLDYEPTLAYYRSLGIDTLVVEDGKCCSAWFYDDYSKAIEQYGLLDAYRRACADQDSDRVFPFPGPEKMHPDRWVADQAIRYIRKCEGDHEFIWISFAGPHYPQDPPQRCMDKIDLSKLPPRKIRKGEWEDASKLHAQSYNGPGVTEGSARALEGAQKNFSQEYWDRWQKGYRGNVILLDECLGDILSAVREKWGNDALIAFTADHGDMSGHHGIWAKNSAVYEDVLQIPLIIHLPGQTQGVEHTEYAANLDLLPTTMRHAFGETLSCDGRDCIDKASAPPDIISEKDNQVAIIHNGRKLALTRFKGTMYRELYDLSGDPNEFENVYSNPAYQADIEEMTALLDKDPNRMPRVFYDSSGYPYWMTPPQPGIPLRPKEEI